MTFHSIICFDENCVSKINSPELDAVFCCFPSGVIFRFSMYSKSTPGLYGLNDFITEGSIHEQQKQPYLT